MSFWIPLLSFIPLILLQGFFSGSELALVSSNRSKLKKAAERGDKAASLVIKFLENPERFLSVTQAGTNYTSITNTSLMTWFFIENVRGPISHEVILSLIVFPLMVIFAEAVPKTMYRHYADRVAPWAARILEVFSLVLFPLLILLRTFTSLLQRAFGASANALRVGPSREELKRVISRRDSKSEFEKEERRLVSKILEFGELQVEDVIVPLIHVQGIDSRKTVQEAIMGFAEMEHSRLPVFDERVDKIIGILHSFDLLGVEAEGDSVDKHMREALFVLEHQRVDDLFERMRKEGHSMVIVVNEYGGAVGIVTVEDIVEHVIGEIDDEFDEGEVNISLQSPDSYKVKGVTPIQEYNDFMPVSIPEGEYETVAGFLLSQFQRVPDVYEFLNVEGVQFTVVAASDRAIDEIHVRIIRPKRSKNRT